MSRVSDTIPAPAGVSGEPVRRGIRAIDNVHTVDGMPTLRIKRTALPPRDQGHYDPNPPDEVVVAIGAHWPASTTVHELGHVIDHHGFGAGAAFVTRTDPRFVGWRVAVATSQALTDLANLRIAAAAASIADLVTHVSYVTG
jgi:hypothetical protein